jgi:hypothetical protein
MRGVTVISTKQFFFFFLRVNPQTSRFSLSGCSSMRLDMKSNKPKSRNSLVNVTHVACSSAKQFLFLPVVLFSREVHRKGNIHISSHAARVNHLLLLLLLTRIGASRSVSNRSVSFFPLRSFLSTAHQKLDAIDYGRVCCSNQRRPGSAFTRRHQRVSDNFHPSVPKPASVGQIDVHHEPLPDTSRDVNYFIRYGCWCRCNWTYHNIDAAKRNFKAAGNRVSRGCQSF